MQDFLQINKFFASVVTLCDIFYSRFKLFFALMFFYKINFSLKDKATCIFSLFFCVLSLANSMWRIPRKKYGISHFQLF